MTTYILFAFPALMAAFGGLFVIGVYGDAIERYMTRRAIRKQVMRKRKQ